MADKSTQQKDVESTAEKVEKTKSAEATDNVEDETKSENGESVENGETEKENGKEHEKKNDDEEEEDETDKVCSIKRKSTSGDAASETPSEGATPEKKAKLAEAESNGQAEVATS